MEVRESFITEEAKIRFGRIGVLMGGFSSERDISLRSGTAVYESLKKQQFDVVAIDIQDSDREKIKQILKKNQINTAFIALHGIFGEDGQIQSILEEMGISYTGSGVQASRNALDKVQAKKIFTRYGLPTPEWVTHYKQDYQNQKPLFVPFSLPWIVKPSANGSSIGVSLVEEPEQVKEALEKAFFFDSCVIVEQFIKGREMTIGIINNRPLCVIEVVPKNRWFDFEAKYQKGLTEYIIPAVLDESLAQTLQDAALAAHRILGCRGFSRVDLMLDKNNKFFILEVNTIPGLTSTSLLPKAAAVAGISFDQLCLQLLETIYEKG
ncbi:MAG: D-alanine--D-alanine ligase [Candidatus Omnitrophica bacterium]|nr:D-alanine--D-alanine ligase [Candidatus Omnitrophota bacterium]